MKLDPTKMKNWEIAEAAEKQFPVFLSQQIQFGCVENMVGLQFNG